MKKIYIATGNRSKLQDFIALFAHIDPEITVELIPELLPTIEDGTTIAENSQKKVFPYIGKHNFPVIANDGGLFFEENLQELVGSPDKVKRNALEGKKEEDLSDQEIGRLMFNFYRNVARNNGGSVKCEWKDVFSILLPDGNIFQTEATSGYELVDREIDFDMVDCNHPLNSLRRSIKTGKFIDEQTKEEGIVDTEALSEVLLQLINYWQESELSLAEKNK